MQVNFFCMDASPVGGTARSQERWRAFASIYFCLCGHLLSDFAATLLEIKSAAAFWNINSILSIATLK
jgi:hypothetical protein